MHPPLSPTQKSTWTWTWLLIALVPFLAAGCTAAGSRETAAQHALTVTATAAGWEAPATAPAGWTAITLDNQSGGMRQAAFYRLDDDKTLDDVFAAIEAGMEGAPPWMTPYGGVSGVMPGLKRTVSANLPAGQYVVIDPVPEADGLPGMAKGYFMPLKVEASSGMTAPPAADLDVELDDYVFGIDYEAVEAGRQTLRVSNLSTVEPHELVVIKLDEGASAEDFLAAMAPGAAAGPPPGQIVAGTAPIDAVTQNVLEIDFEAGARYALICFLPSVVHEGAPHFTFGMVEEWTVSN